MNTRLCAENEVPDGQGRGITVGELAVVVVRRGTALFAYENVCPHFGVNLEWVDHRFMSKDGRFLQCSTHGALFRVEDGECVSGPCLGDKLRALPIERRDGYVFLAEM